MSLSRERLIPGTRLHLGFQISSARSLAARVFERRFARQKPMSIANGRLLTFSVNSVRLLTLYSFSVKEVQLGGLSGKTVVVYVAAGGGIARSGGLC